MIGDSLPTWRFSRFFRSCSPPGQESSRIGTALRLVFAGGAAAGWCVLSSARIGTLRPCASPRGLTAVLILALLPLSLEAGAIAAGDRRRAQQDIVRSSMARFPNLVAPERRARAFSIFYTGSIGAGFVFAPASVRDHRRCHRRDRRSGRQRRRVVAADAADGADLKPVLPARPSDLHSMMAAEMLHRGNTAAQRTRCLQGERTYQRPVRHHFGMGRLWSWDVDTCPAWRTWDRAVRAKASARKVGSRRRRKSRMDSSGRGDTRAAPMSDPRTKADDRRSRCGGTTRQSSD